MDMIDTLIVLGLLALLYLATLGVEITTLAEERRQRERSSGGHQPNT
jgi:hypothetical protein